MTRVGVMAVGLAAYWPQFPAMRDGLLDHHRRVMDKFPGGVETVRAGLVDDADAAHAAGRMFRAADLDVVFCHLTTYASAETLLPAIRELDVPVVLLNVQSVAALDMDEVRTIPDWLGIGCTCAGLPEMTAALIRIGKRFAVVTGHLDGDDVVDREIARWCTAASVRQRLRSETIGLLGRPYPGMMDLAVDETRIFARFGTYVRHLQWEDLAAACGTADQAGSAERVAAAFDREATLDRDDVRAIADVLDGFERMVSRHHLCAIANHFETAPTGRQADMLAALNPVLSLLNAQGVACPVEADVKTALAMLMLRPFAGSATLAELYSMDFTADVCVIGHSGAGDPAISDVKPRLSASDVFHGKSGRGYLTQFFPAEGPVTLVSLAQDRAGDYRLVAAEGECVPGRPMRLGDTNARIRFDCGVRAFVNRWSAQGPTHHGALGRGHHIENLGAIATMFDIPLVVVG